MKRGIYVVANLKSQNHCVNLVHSIREGGCTLPIRLIHFGGKPVNSEYLLSNVEHLDYSVFPDEAKEFVEIMRTVITDCPRGFLYRFLAWFSDWDEFIYSDNDIVALCDWTKLFDYLDGYDLVHADKEYTTNGLYNYDQPALIEKIFGVNSHESAVTAGHMVIKRNIGMIDDLKRAVVWFGQNPNIAKKHDQSLLHVASLLGNWKILNLCKTKDWLSTWAGDYKNSLELIQKIQASNSPISHIHYSGYTPKGDKPIHELLLSEKNDNDRLSSQWVVALKSLSGYNKIGDTYLKSSISFKRYWFKGLHRIKHLTNKRN